MYPLAMLLIVGFVPEDSTIVMPTSGFGEFIAKWWWMLLVASAFAVSLVFIGHVLRNSARLKWTRPLWLLAFLVAAPLALPIYWWRYADAT